MSSKRQRKFHRKWNHVAKSMAKRRPQVRPQAKLQIYQPPMYPNRALYPGEISRTEQEPLPLYHEVIKGKKGPLVDPNSFCQACKNKDTTRVVDPIALEPFIEHYGGRGFRVYSCHCCGAVWSHEITRAVAEMAA